METMTTVSLGSGIALVAILLQVIKFKTESAAQMATLEQRVVSLEARAKSVDADLKAIRSDLSELKALYMRLEGYLKRTPPPA